MPPICHDAAIFIISALQRHLFIDVFLHDERMFIFFFFFFRFDTPLYATL